MSLLSLSPSLTTRPKCHQPLAPALRTARIARSWKFTPPANSCSRPAADHSADAENWYVSGMDHLQRIERLDRLARILDSAITIPGTDVKVGIDPLLGLIPGIGDGIASLLSGVILYEAAKLGTPKHILVRMLGNIGADALIGAVPIFGDLFDFAFRANRRNLDLLRSVSPAAYGAPRNSRAIGRLIAAVMLLVFALLLTGAFYIAKAAYTLLTS